MAGLLSGGRRTRPDELVFLVFLIEPRRGRVNDSQTERVAQIFWSLLLLSPPFARACGSAALRLRNVLAEEGTMLGMVRREEGAGEGPSQGEANMQMTNRMKEWRLTLWEPLAKQYEMSGKGQGESTTSKPERMACLSCGRGRGNRPLVSGGWHYASSKHERGKMDVMQYAV